LELITVLRADHLLIDDLAGALFQWSAQLLGGEAASQDGTRFAATLRTLLEAHHEREEVLFRALVDDAEVAGDRGPLAVLREEHLRTLELVAVLASDAGRPDDNTARVAHQLSHLLREHLDKENSVLFPEAEMRLNRNGIRQLEVRPPTTAEETAIDDARALFAGYPPLEDDEVVRGDGCVACAAFTETCHGIEAEWWTTWEWAHHRSLEEG